MASLIRAPKVPPLPPLPQPAPEPEPEPEPAPEPEQPEPDPEPKEPAPPRVARAARPTIATSYLGLLRQNRLQPRRKSLLGE